MDDAACQRILDNLWRHYEDNLVYTGQTFIEMSFTVCYLDDHFTFIFYERGDSIAWDLETGEVRTL